MKNYNNSQKMYVVVEIEGLCLVRTNSFCWFGGDNKNLMVKQLFVLIFRCLEIFNFNIFINSIWFENNNRYVCHLV